MLCCVLNEGNLIKNDSLGFVIEIVGQDVLGWYQRGLKPLPGLA